MHVAAWPRIARILSKPFVFFTIMMALKIYLARFVIFDGGHVWMPLATGIPSVWVAFCLVELLFYKRKLGAYLTVNLILTSVYFAVIMYYKYFGVIVTYHALQQVGQVTEVKSSVFSLLHPYFLLIYVDIVVLFILLLSSRKVRAWGRSLAVREPRAVSASVGALSIVMCAASIYPYKDGMNEILQAQKMGILNYEAYVAFGASKDEPVDTSEVTQERIREIKGIEDKAEPAYWEAAKGKNVIIIQLEAFQNFLIGMEVDGKEVTPNLNKLASESFYFPHFYQQVGQGNTSDAEFVVNTSFFIPPHGAASQVYADKELPSMPKTLAEHGYDTATFHTNDVSFWNREELYQALGFGQYYDTAFFGEEDFVMFGASDEVLYEKTAGVLETMRQSGKPFYAQVISMSAHHPFNLPERKIRMELPEKYDDTLVGHYIGAQNYADLALGQFIERLKSSGIWDESLVIIYGDHQGLPVYSLTKEEKSLMKEIYGRDYESPDMLNIPLILKLPGQTEGQVLEQTGGQSDLFPTIANLAGISLDDHIHFGQDILNETENVLPQRYYLPSGSFVNDGAVFVPGLGFEDGVVYPFSGGEAAEGDVTEEQYENALELISMSDSYVESLPERN
ncbi:LTA synthase family protein [Cohnella massiliensis]|uniref:LTA synthase family protein n=2 Tax=Cohnella TaxID=329857 RepID=UPI003CCC2253